MGLFGTRNRLALVPGAHFNASVDKMLIMLIAVWVSQCNSHLKNGVNDIQDFKLAPLTLLEWFCTFFRLVQCAFDDEATIVVIC